jgi:L-ascorbate metabolism protein UlaG (beta-lactamase superfamily)
MPGAMLTSEMSPREGILAAQWLGLKTILPCHYIHPKTNPDVQEFQHRHAEAKARGEEIGESIVLNPGEWLELRP